MECEECDILKEYVEAYRKGGTAMINSEVVAPWEHKVCLTERESEFRRLRLQCGYTFQQIADKYHLSAERVRQILLKADRKVSRSATYKFPAYTPIRIRNALIRVGYHSSSDLVGMSLNDLMQIRNIGKESAEWIYNNFCIHEEKV